LLIPNSCPADEAESNHHRPDLIEVATVPELKQMIWTRHPEWGEPPPWRVKITLLIRLLFAAACVMTVRVSAQTTLSNPLGAALGSSHSVADDQFLGTRFTLDTEFEVSELSANFTSANNLSFFAAIVSLPNDTAFPTASSTNGLSVGGEIVFSTTFTPGIINTLTTISIPASITLDPGVYGIVFGSGILGSSASAYGAMQNYDFTTGSETIAWTAPSTSWGGPQFDVIANGTPTYGISITGTAIPEPSSAAIIFGLAALVMWQVRRRRSSAMLPATAR
jgi:hypothetical protein